jgi:hypothetical protein
VGFVVLVALSLLLVGGAIAAPGTFLRSFAMATDMFFQCLFWNDALGVTISSRCGLLARRGHHWPARFVNFVMFSPTHCERSIAGDRQRAVAALALLDASITPKTGQTNGR